MKIIYTFLQLRLYLLFVLMGLGISDFTNRNLKSEVEHDIIISKITIWRKDDGIMNDTFKSCTTALPTIKY